MEEINMIKVLIADDQELIRQSLQIVLKSQPDIEITSAVANGKEVIYSVKKKLPDVILMDIRMPEIDGVQCTQIIKKKYPHIKIIILTTFDDDEYVLNALRDGASGYLLKGVSIEELVDAIRKVNSGSYIMNSDITDKVMHLFSQMAQSNLSIRVKNEDVEEICGTEWKVIKLVGCGLSNKEVAAKLSLSEGTVRNYLSSILNKLKLRDRTQLAIWTVQTGAATHKLEYEK
jgi:DNA-binding NarL/FixJ family response regulator